MSNEKLAGTVNPFAPETSVASKETTRKFVKDLLEISERIQDKKSDLKEVVDSMDEITSIKDQIKELREDMKKKLSESEVVQSYLDELNDVIDEKKQLISDAKQDGVPKKEIDAAIKMLKKDVDPKLTSEVYSNISDLIDV